MKIRVSAAPPSVSAGTFEVNFNGSASFLHSPLQLFETVTFKLPTEKLQYMKKTKKQMQLDLRDYSLADSL